MRKLDYEAIEAQKNSKALEDFLNKNRLFIQNCIYKRKKAYITKSDDEWSIAIMAFSQAVKDYDIEKGSFYSFAEQIINRRLIDYYRTQSKYKAEISVNPHIFESDPEQEDDDISIKIEVSQKNSFQQDDSLKYEIEAANETFMKFGFSFFDLTECSPKAEKTKTCCAKVIGYILENKLILNEIYHSKQLPIKIIENNLKVPRKILERHRKYIIAAIEILSGEYPCLSEYMWTIRKELDK